MLCGSFATNTPLSLYLSVTHGNGDKQGKKKTGQLKKWGQVSTFDIWQGAGFAMHGEFSLHNQNDCLYNTSYLHHTNRREQ